MSYRAIHAAVLAVALTAAVPVPSGAAAADTPAQQASARHKVILHVGDGDPAKWTVALNNVFNVRQELGAANVDIEVVAINAGIGILKLESPQASRIVDAQKGGVKFVACENSMKGQKVTRDDMLPGIGYAPAGVVELMERQREGYAYIRP